MILLLNFTTVYWPFASNPGPSLVDGSPLISLILQNVLRQTPATVSVATVSIKPAHSVRARWQSDGFGRTEACALMARAGALTPGFGKANSG